MDTLADLLRPYFVANTTIVAALVFGSGAAGRLRADSDLDLALLFAPERAPDDSDVLQIRADLEQVARRDVDLIVLNSASPIVAYQAVRKGQPLFCRDRGSYERFVVRLISAYADLKQIRRPIEDAVIARRTL